MEASRAGAAHGRRLPAFPLVMHGSSSVPKAWVDRINAAGGKLSGAKGVDDNQFKRAAQLGVTKINIDTDGRLVWTRVHREFFKQSPEKFDLLAKHKLKAASCSSPVIVEGRMYLRLEDGVACYDLRK